MADWRLPSRLIDLCFSAKYIALVSNYNYTGLQGQVKITRKAALYWSYSWSAVLCGLFTGLWKQAFHCTGILYILLNSSGVQGLVTVVWFRRSPQTLTALIPLGEWGFGGVAAATYVYLNYCTLLLFTGYWVRCLTVRSLPKPSTVLSTRPWTPHTSVPCGRWLVTLLLK